MKLLKIINQILVGIPLIFLTLFFNLFIQVKLDMDNIEINYKISTIYLMVISVLSIFIALILLSIRRFVYNEKKLHLFTIIIFVEMLIISLIYFNFGNILWYVFG